MKVFNRKEIRDLLLDKNQRNENTLWFSLRNYGISTFETFYENTRKCLNFEDIERMIFEPNNYKELAFNNSYSKKPESVDKLREISDELFGEKKMSIYFK